MMKSIYQFSFFLFVMLAFTACTKNDKKVILGTGNAPVLAASGDNSLIFNKDQADMEAVTFTWNNPEYSFNTGVSSQDVNYLLEIDTTGSNFTNPSRAQIAISKDLSKTFTVKDLNTLLNTMNLDFGVAHEVEFRLRASLMNGAAAQYSNVIKKTITPYLDTKYPVPAKLFVTGGATPVGWQAGNGSEPEPPEQTFTKTNAYTFELVVALKANESYLFIPVYSSWSAKYGFDGANNENNTDGDNFKPDGGDMKAPSTGGIYKITVDFKLGKWTVAKQ